MFSTRTSVAFIQAAAQGALQDVLHELFFTFGGAGPGSAGKLFKLVQI